MTMQPDRLQRVGGGVLLAGVGLTFVGTLLTILADGVGSSNPTAWVIIHLLEVIGGAAGLLSLPVIFLRQADHIKVVGLVGFVLLFLGFLFFGFFTPMVATFLLPWVYDKGSCALGCHLLDTHDGPPLLGLLYLVEYLATIVGLVVFGFATVRAAVFPRAAGYVMIAAAVLLIPSAFFGATYLLGVVGEGVALVAVAWLALRLLTETSAA